MMINQVVVFCIVVIMEAANGDWVTWWENTYQLDYGSDECNHFRQCADSGIIATYHCNTGVLHVCGCWYGSPASDQGFYLCRHAANGHCDAVIGNCMNYIGAQCNGKKTCSVDINQHTMGGDPCPGIYKFAAVAMSCVVPGAKAKPAQMIDNEGLEINDLLGDNKDGNQPEPGYDYDYDGENKYILHFSSESVVYGIGGIIGLLLLVNILCLCYRNCGGGGNKVSKYQKVAQFVSSDDDMQNLKECKI